MRPDILNPLFAEISGLKGVGPALSKPLQKLGLLRVKDALYHFPTNWIYRKTVSVLDEADVGATIIVELTIADHRSGRSPRSPTRIFGVDKVGNYLDMVFFGKNGGWARKQLPVGETRIISGKLDRFGDQLQMVHPESAPPTDTPHFAPSEAVYPLSEGISNRKLGQIISASIERVSDLPEWIDSGLLQKQNWPSWRQGLGLVHLGDSEAARDRLAYDELFANQLATRLVRATLDKRQSKSLQGDGQIVAALNLPFDLTGAQRRTVEEIDGDLQQSRPMLRLLQGDVGSGKTAVAFHSLARAAECRVQSVLLAPTEILVRQHYQNLQSAFAGTGVNLAILTGRDKGKVREATLMGLADGSIDILVGTHSVFQEAVQYKSLALVIIDEQHRFGVSQRLLLTQKAKLAPHLLVMTATPIPRSLALACYGDMDISQLDEMPPGRQPVETLVLSEHKLAELVEGVGRHLSTGQQAYWVCPLVEESEKSELAAAEQRMRELQLRFGDKVAMVHGRMSGPEKDAVMERFTDGFIGLLVATTVIEVGVDVPNASLMIIESADRFGLAQLHQLRGRVGRGSAKSTCILVRSENIGETARARLALMRKTNDGFLIAEEDLRLRGAGEMLGTRQSGENAFRIATPEQVQRLINTAADDARLLLDRDGGLSGERGHAARIALYLMERDIGVTTLRSG
jgi:ATP-dependent DNA helicase RecG